MPRQRLIFATANQHKIDEVKAVLDTTKFELLSLADVGIIEDIEETGSTLEENALIKARFVGKKSNCIVFSEDTGLEVAALDGQPGVHTARYGGPEKNADQNMKKLLKALETKEDRSAQFRAVIALVHNERESLFEGIAPGSIAKGRSGVEGFGYDPVFIPKGYSKTFAKLPDHIKLGMSHRTRALQKLIHYLEVLPKR